MAVTVVQRVLSRFPTESINGTTSGYSLVARPPAYEAILGQLKKQTGRDEITAVIIQCIYSYTTLQVFFVFKALNLQERVRAKIVGADNSAQEHVTLSFMEIFERRKLNLDTLKHGRSEERRVGKECRSR